MASLVKVTLVGNLGRDAEMRSTPQGKAVLEFNVACNDRYTDNTGAQQERTQWFRVSLWGRQAETLKQYLLKGKQVLVDGRLRAREYVDREGKTRTSLDVHADNLVLLGSRAGGPQESQGPVDNGGQGGGFNGPDKQFSPDDDDIPF